MGNFITALDRGKEHHINKDWIKDFKDNEAMISYLYNVIVPWYRHRDRKYWKKCRRRQAIKRFKVRLMNIFGKRTPGQKVKDNIHKFYKVWQQEIKQSEFH